MSGGIDKRDLLMETLEQGVGFHSADLTFDERRVVEHGFRNRQFKVLISTSTLAVGLNMPSCNVFISPDKWCYEKDFGMPWKTPILRSEYENMGGARGGGWGVDWTSGVRFWWLARSMTGRLCGGVMWKGSAKGFSLV